MVEYIVKSLDADIWPSFARLVEASNGVWGECWCMWYHCKDDEASPDAKRAAKERLVREGRAHAALVFKDDKCVGWCQFGPPRDLPRIHDSRAYLATSPRLPDWRVTCFLPGKGHRGKGIASAALQDAIELIGKLGGGRVEGYPEDIAGRKASPAFLFNVALSTFESLGFERARLIGKHKGVVTRTIPHEAEASIS